MKKIIAWMLTILLLLTMSACQTGSEETTIRPTIDPPGSSGPSRPVMKEPPGLTVSFGGGDSFEATTVIYGWNYDNGDGTMSGIEADGPHPLDLYERLSAVETTEPFVELQFEVSPQNVTVRCWDDTCWGNTNAVSETAYISGNMLELKGHGYIYEVIATWTGENLAANGTVHYVFYIVKHNVQYAHDNPLARTPGNGDKPDTGYCGNTITKLLIDGTEYAFEGSDSVNLTDLLINLEYDPDLLCKCLPDFCVETEFGMTYGISWSGYARCEAGQADLTPEQMELIRRIVDTQT